MLRHVVRLLAAAFFVSAAANAANAVAIYTYTGNFFNEFSPEPGGVPGQYTGANRVTGWFSVAAPFANGFTGSFTPLDFSFTDGRGAISSPLNILVGASFLMQIDGAGQIVYWDILLERSPIPPALPARTIRTFGGPGEFSVDFGNVVNCLAPFCAVSTQDFGRVEGAYGTWVLTQTPVPGALPLFATGIGVIGALVWRRKRKARAD